MKKYLFPVVTSFLIGTIMAIILINSYENVQDITLSKNVKNIYYIQRGVYKTKESMQVNMASFESYIYNVEDNKYHAYIGITTNKENALKIKDYFQKQKIDSYIKKKATDNKTFLNILNQYDEILKKTEDQGTIRTICNQVLSKYEELINNEY